MANPCGTLQLTPITEHEFPVVRELAETIWRQHYTGIISPEQIDYMLAGRSEGDDFRGANRSPRRKARRTHRKMQW